LEIAFKILKKEKEAVEELRDELQQEIAEGLIKFNAL